MFSFFTLDFLYTGGKKKEKKRELLYELKQIASSGKTQMNSVFPV